MKKKFSIVTFAFILFISGSINAQKYFRVFEATSSSWSGGTPQSGSGTTYIIKAILLTAQKISFSDIWIGKEYGNPEVISLSYADGRKLSKGDSILIRYTVHHYPPNSPMSEIPKSQYKLPPIPIQGDALVSFSIGNSKRYRSIPKFKSLVFQSYP